MTFPSPSVSTPSLAPWQLSFNGLTFGGILPGTPYQLVKITGLDLPAVRTADVNRSRDHGELIGLDLLAGRDIVADLIVQTDGISVAHAVFTLGQALVTSGTTEVPLFLSYPNLTDSTLVTLARIRKKQLPVDVSLVAGQFQQVSAQWHATDYRLYGSPSQTVTIPLGTLESGGLTFPLTFPAVFNPPTIPPGSAFVTNAGNVEMRPVLVITGPCTNPSVENSTIAGAPAITLSNPYQTGFTVQAGDQLVIDMDLHTVLYYTGGVAAGTSPAAYRGWVVYGSQWWNLPPGPNLIRFSSDDVSSVGGTCQVQWADAYSL